VILKSISHLALLAQSNLGNINKLKENIVQNGVQGLICLGLVFGGFIWALIFDNKIGYLLVIGGFVWMAKLWGLF